MNKNVKLIGKSLLYAVGFIAIATLFVTGILFYVPPKVSMIIAFCMLWVGMYKILEK